MWIGNPDKKGGGVGQNQGQDQDQARMVQPGAERTRTVKAGRKYTRDRE